MKNCLSHQPVLLEETCTVTSLSDVDPSEIEDKAKTKLNRMV